MTPVFEVLNFSENWNHKLDCTAFTTIRIESAKYQIGQFKAIKLKGKLYKSHLYQIKAIKRFKLSSINDYMAYVDTGYNAQTCRNIIEKMYNNKGVNWKTTFLCMPLLVKTNYEISEQSKLML